MRYWLILVVILAGCAPKKEALVPTVDEKNLLDEICQIETGRHGEVKFHSNYTYFGNRAMDRYRDAPGSPQVLQQYFELNTGICRGALLQMFMESHRPWLLLHWQEIDRGLSNQERMHVLLHIRQNKYLEFEELVYHYLEHSSHEDLRWVAAVALYVFDQSTKADTIQGLMHKEPSDKVVREMVLSLHVDRDPSLNNILVGLKDHPNEDIHEAILTQWATSDLENKSELIATYSKHPNGVTRDKANHLLAQLKSKDKLQYVVQEEKPKKYTTRPMNEVSFEKHKLMRASLLANDFEMVQAAVEQGISPNDRVQGSTYLHQALLNSNMDIVKYLVEQGGDLDAKIGSQNLLMYIAQKGFKDVEDKIDFLVAQGVDVNATNDRGETAMLLATFNNRVQSIRALLKNGANPNLRDDLGRTPLDLARLLENDQIVTLLEAEGY